MAAQWTTAQRSTLINMRRDGLPWDDVSAATGRSIDACMNFAIRYNLLEECNARKAIKMQIGREIDKALKWQWFEIQWQDHVFTRRSMQNMIRRLAAERGMTVNLRSGPEHLMARFIK